MKPEIFEYIQSQRVGVLAVEMPDGSPHAATVHFAHVKEPLVFFFETFRASRKAEPFLQKGAVRASFVIGTDEKAMKTFQIDGTAELVKPEEKENFSAVYLGKFPEKAERSKSPNAAAIKFTPKWWRFSDLSDPQAKVVLTSE